MTALEDYRIESLERPDDAAWSAIGGGGANLAPGAADLMAPDAGNLRPFVEDSPSPLGMARFFRQFLLLYQHGGVGFSLLAVLAD